MKRILFITIAATLLGACGTETNQSAETTTPASKLDEVSWMIGTWEMQAPDGSGIFIEHWQKADAHTMSGSGLMIQGGDTVFSEKLQLVNENGELWYVPTIANQNGGQPVRFKEKSISANELVFENLGHDFPQRIVYQRKGDNALYARVEGMQSNALRKEEFSFKRKVD
jgi:hypothetical protein